MDAIMHALGNNWWLLFVFGGSIGGAVRGVAAWNERRAQRRLERYRIKQATKAELAKAKGMGRVDRETARRELTKTVAEHDTVDDRWFGYETDLATILDFPMMIDMREPLTVEFHKARHRADLLRPQPPESLLDSREALGDYREAVHAYATAFDIAEQEAHRRRRGDFDALEQERLARAQRLLAVAVDAGATPDERQQAYARARRELYKSEAKRS
ncbi:hypothetical protein GCM10023147_18490 [Tsukamurella soli]|uniref:Uncharacterized protein n=1 Tax=Tsukamurella soli TaxID=644556 RepID=A0ABP8JGQ1_9ACTN